MGLRDLDRVGPARLSATATGRATALDNLRDAASRERAAPAGEEVQPYLRQWLHNPDAPHLFALLGEYGMGKTINCQLLARELDAARRNDPSLPIPLYFDLRHVAGLRERVPSLEETLRDCMQRGWLDTQSGNAYSLDDIHRWIAQGALLVFDGLDEVLVKLSAHDGQTFTNQLLKLLADAEARAKLAQRPLRLKMLISCRTQYFPTLQAQQNHFTQQERGEQRADRYQAMLLLPWDEQQVRSYLSHALPEMDSDALLAMLGAVHNLTELSQRPYTLRLLAEHIPDIERLRASGQPVYGVTLYRQMAEKWLARDSGKHHLSQEHKLRLASQLAAHLWRSGKPALPAGELHDWLHAWLDSEPALRSRYQRLHPDQLEEDLRTATFLARDDDDTTQRSTFRFAHTSLLEFFLACHLRDAARNDHADAWALPLPSQETLDFFGQLLAEAPSSECAAMLAQLSRWARHATPQRSELLLAYTLRSHRQGWPAPELRNADFSHAKLHEWVFVGSAEHPLRLEGASFADADLTRSEWRHVQLAGANLQRAALEHAIWQDIDASGADFRHTQLTATVFRHCVLHNTDWRDASGYRAQWLNCQPAGAPWAAAMPPALERTVLAPLAEAKQQASLTWQQQTLLTLYILDRRFTAASIYDAQGRIWLARATGRQVNLIDQHSGEISASLIGHEAEVRCCAFAPQSDVNGALWLASGDQSGVLRLWRLPDGQPGPALHGHQQAVHHCAFSPPQADGAVWLASADEAGQIRLWRMPDGAAGPVLNGHADLVRYLAFSPLLDGVGWLASAGEDRIIRLWRLPDGAPGPVLRRHTGTVTCCAFMPQPDADGVLWLLSAGEDGTLRQWRAPDGQPGWVRQVPQGIIRNCSISAQPDGDGVIWLATIASDGHVCLWRMPDGQAGPSWRPSDDRLNSCAFMPMQAQQPATLLLNTLKNSVWQWLLPQGKPRLLGHSQYGGFSSAFCLWLPPAQPGAPLRLLAASAKQAARAWDVESGQISLTLTGHTAEISGAALAAAPDHQGVHWLATASRDGAVRTWRLADGQAGPVWLEHEHAVFSCAFASGADPDGRLWLASTGRDGVVRLWQLPEGQPGPELVHSEVSAVFSCAWAPTPDSDGRSWLATAGDDGAVRLWRAPNQRASRVLRGHDGSVFCCAFAPTADAQGIVWLASAGDDHTVRLWQTPSGQPGPVLRGHEATVRHCAFAPGPDVAGVQWLASASDDHTVRLWRMPDGAPGPVLCGHTGGVRHCCFAYTIDGALWLASSSDDGTLRIWDIPSGRCLRVLAQCEASPGGQPGYAMWNPETQEVLAVAGDAWRYLHWQQPRPGLLPERLPLEAFGPVPYRESMD